MKPIFLAAAVLLSLIPLWPVYDSPAFFVAVAGGALLGAGIALWSARRSWSILRTVIVSILVYLVAGVPLAVPSQSFFGIFPSLQGELNLLSGVVLSWKQLVTVMPPVGSYEALLVPAFLLAFVGVELAVLLSLRIPVQSSRSLWAPLMPVVTSAVSIWIGPRQPFISTVVAVAVFALIALWFISSRPGVSRGGMGAVVVLVVGALVAAGVLAVTTPSNRSVWRTSIDQPFVLQESTSPLAEYRSYVLGDSADQTLLTVTGVAPGDRLSIATLDRYTGVVYSVGGQAVDFTKLPGSIALEGDRDNLVSVTVEINQLTGPWVPLPGELGSLRFTGAQSATLTNSFYYSRPAQTGAVVSGLNAGTSYRSTGATSPWVSANDLSTLTPGDALIPAPELMPDGVEAFISRAALGKTAPADRLQAALQALASQGYVSHGGPGEVASASGHGANRISALFAAKPMVGDAEQYATAAALIATESGFPARVVMGFIVPETSVADTAHTFSGAQMTAWIEISTAQGWVAYDPNPLERPIPEQQPEDPTEVAFPQTAVDPPAQEEQQLNDTTSPEATQEEQPTPVDPVLQVVLAVVSVVGWSALWLGVLSSPLIAIAVMKRRRTARRRSSPVRSEKAQGAWDEAQDLFEDYGLDTPASLTRREIADESGTDSALPLAVIADAAQYSESDITESEADAAWRYLDEINQHLASTHTRWQRIRSRLSLSSLHITRSWFSRWTTKQR